MSEQEYTVKAAAVTKTDVGQYGNSIVTATIENAEGKSAEVEIMQKPTTPVPAVGEKLTGTVTKNEYGLRFRKASKFNGNGYSGNNREDSIDRAVAVKSATEIVSARIRSGEIKGEDAPVAALAAMTEDILAIVKNSFEKAAEGKAQEAKKAAEPDSDIPF